MAAGFIHDKLEIRFLILYIASRLHEPVSGEDLQELTMIDPGVNLGIRRYTVVSGPPAGAAWDASEASPAPSPFFRGSM